MARVAFDLDGTLIPAPGEAMPIEALGLLARLVSSEPLRAGTTQLFRELQRQGHELWLYTTSFRNPLRLRLWFWAVGIHLNGVINQRIHDDALRHQSIRSSKYPPAFGIDVLVDDSEGVRLEGERHGFAVLVLQPEEPAWHEHVHDFVATHEQRSVRWVR